MESDLKSYLNMVEVMSGFDSTWIPLKAELNEAVKAATNSKTSTKQVLPNPPVAN